MILLSSPKVKTIRKKKGRKPSSDDLGGEDALGDAALAFVNQIIGWVEANALDERVREFGGFF